MDLRMIVVCTLLLTVQAIYDINPETKNCRAYGDPHYNTFDGKPIHFQGQCTYLLAGTCLCSPLDSIQVYVSSSFCHPWTPNTCVHEVIMKLYGYTVVFERFGTVTVTPLWPPTTLFSITTSGTEMTLTTHDGVIVHYNGIYNVDVTIPCKYFDEMCGICADADGNAANDWTLSNGTDVTSEPNKYNLIGNSWRVILPGHDDGCDDTDTATEGAQDLTPANFDRLVAAPEPPCNLIRDETGAFGACARALGRDAGAFVEGCVWDLVAAGPDQPQAACHAMEAFINECARRGHVYNNWRITLGCQCEPNVCREPEQCYLTDVDPGFYCDDDPCSPNPCQSGYVCTADPLNAPGYTCTDPCVNAQCPTGHQCALDASSPTGYTCTDPCANAKCPTGHQCVRDTTSPNGYICNDPCDPDPCGRFVCRYSPALPFYICDDPCNPNPCSTTAPICRYVSTAAKFMCVPLLLRGQIGG